MARLVVLYKTPKDAAAFDKYYAESRISIAKMMPGLRKYQVSQGPVVSPAGPSGVHLILPLTFDGIAAIQTAFASPEEQAAGAGVASFATGGAELMFFDTKEV